MSHMVLLLRQSDQVIRVRTCSACECDSQFTTAESLTSGGSELARRPIRPLAAPSLSIPLPSPTCSRTFAGSRSEGSFYGQVARFLDSTSSPTGSAWRWHHQPMGGGSAATVPQVASRPWLSAKPSAAFVVKTNMFMIVCRRKSCRKFIIGWCPISAIRKPPS